MDTDSLDALYRRHAGQAILYCLALCGDEQLAQDLVAEAFVKACLSLPEDTSSFPYWLLRVCRNLWIDHLRRHRLETSADPLPYLTDGITPENQYIQKEERRALWMAVCALPRQDRELVTLHYFSGLSLKEIAPLMGKSYAAVRQRLTRLRQTLRIKMEEQGYGF